MATDHFDYIYHMAQKSLISVFPFYNSDIFYINNCLPIVKSIISEKPTAV